MYFFFKKKRKEYFLAACQMAWVWRWGEVFWAVPSVGLILLRPTTWNSAPCASHVGIPISHTSRMRIAFFYLYKNLNACVPSRRCLSSSGSIYLYKNLNACGKPPQGGTESTGTTCQGWKHLDFYINKKPPQGAQKARETTCQGWKHLDFYINKKPPQRGTESTGDKPARDGSI